jgi:hypothetical protein
VLSDLWHIMQCGSVWPCLIVIGGVVNTLLKWVYSVRMCIGSGGLCFNSVKYLVTVPELVNHQVVRN